MQREIRRRGGRGARHRALFGDERIGLQRGIVVGAVEEGAEEFVRGGLADGFAGEDGCWGERCWVGRHFRIFFFFHVDKVECS